MRNRIRFAAVCLVVCLLAGVLAGCREAAPGAVPTSLSTSAPSTPAGQQAAATTSPTAQTSPTQGNPGGTQSPSINSQGKYAVILVGEGGVLNVRQNPGTSSQVLETLSAHAAGFSLTGKTSQLEGDSWVEINRLNGGTGWVNAQFITEYKESSVFCGDAQATVLLDAFKGAVLDKNGEDLAALVSPLHGLTVHYLRGGNTATYTPEMAGWLFTSTYQMDWGPNPASGQEVRGNFHEEVLPKLVDVLSAAYTPACDNVLTGGVSYKAQWPFEYGNINFYGLYRPGPAGNEQNWRTWLVGIEYVNGKPYLFSLVHLFWEP